MGLDMYLYRKTYVKNWDFTPPDKITTVTVTRNGLPIPYINPANITYVVEEVAYWRKANAIHEWFVTNCQDGVDDCRESYVSPTQLKMLIEECKEALSNLEDAANIPPTKSGFFFGSTEYDSYYIEDLKQTIDMLTPLIEDETQSLSGFYYLSSW